MTELSLSSAGGSVPIPLLAQPCWFLPAAPGCRDWSSSGLGCTGTFGAHCKGFPCSKADPCCRHSPVFLQKVPQLLRRAAALAEPLPSRWCHVLEMPPRKGTNVCKITHLSLSPAFYFFPHACKSWDPPCQLCSSLKHELLRWNTPTTSGAAFISGLGTM